MIGNVKKTANTAFISVIYFKISDFHMFFAERYYKIKAYKEIFLIFHH